MFKIIKKNYLSIVFIGLLSTGCASTNSVGIANLEKTDKMSYEFLKRTHSWVEIDTSSENYSKWKAGFLNASLISPISKVQECINMKDSISGTISGTGKIGFNTYKNCLPTSEVTPKKVTSTFQSNNIFGWITVIQSTPKRWSQDIYEDYETYKMGIIEYGNKAELFTQGSYRWGYSAEKDGVARQDAFRNGVWAQDKENTKIILKTLDQYNVQYKMINN